MRYVLILGIIYDYYRQPATIDIRTNDRIISQIVLEKSAQRTTIKKLRSHVDGNNLTAVDKWIHERVPEKYVATFKEEAHGYDLPVLFKTLEIDEQDLMGDLTLQVKNSNSNYTNGFMTKSSTLQFPMVALIPKYFLGNNHRKLVQVLDRFNTAFNQFDSKRRRPGLWRLPRPLDVPYDLRQILSVLGMTIEPDKDTEVPKEMFMDHAEKYLENNHDTEIGNTNIINMWYNDIRNAEDNGNKYTHLKFPSPKILEYGWPIPKFGHVKKFDSQFKKELTKVERVSAFKIGGSFELSFSIKKKHGLKYLFAEGQTIETDRGFWGIDIINCLMLLIKQINTNNEN